MIKKHEILGLAKEMGLNPSIVGKDYVLGWVLAGINQHHAISNDWVFKGGPVLKNVTLKHIVGPKIWILPY